MRMLPGLVVSALPLAAQQSFAEWPRSQVPALPAPVLDLAVLDVDADGDADLVAVLADGTTNLLLGDGEGAFTVATLSVAVPGAAAVALATGDFDGNRLEDIVIAPFGGVIRLVLQTSIGFLPGPALPLGADVTALVAFDADGDGDRDLAAATSGGITLLENRSSLLFTATPLGGSGNPESLLAFDADGDGDSDLLAVGFGQGELLVNLGGGVFGTGAPLPNVHRGWRRAAAGDVDGDGDIDLAIGTAGGFGVNQELLLLNQGNASFLDATTGRLPPQGLETAVIALVDFDRDGDLDLLAGLDRGNDFGSRKGLAIWLNNGAGVFAAADGLLPANDLPAQAFAFPDVDRDGDADVVFGNRTVNGLQLYWNDQGPFVHVNAAPVPYRHNQTADIAAGDLDGDGLPEIAAVGWNFPIVSSANALSRNDGTGQFAEVPWNVPFGLYSAVAMADVDGDGDRDVALAVEQGQVRLLRNDGALAFTEVTATQVPTAMTFTQALAVVDFDGDGDRDLVVGNLGASLLYRNDGSGTFTDVSATLMPGAPSAASLAIDDVDGDGDPDLVCGATGGLALLQNRGGSLGFVRVNGALPASTDDTAAVALADVDGDGDPDLLVGNRRAANGLARSWLLVNDGSGVFTGTRYLLSTRDVTALAAGDLEGDGDVDLVLGGIEEPVEVWDNRGFGFVVQALTAPGELRRTTALRLIDVEGDGDLDVYLGAENADRLLRNLHRQAAFSADSDAR
ncbi:MAG: VCBS repeat-containing protein [Planctomycetes bacterium]|nr:VCBS repeat-containing protein [Planctomycetota bacterium]